MSAPHYKLKIPPEVQEQIKPNAPKESRMSAAKGLLPLPPAALATVLTFLQNDPDEEIKSTALAELLAIPPPILNTILTQAAHPKTLHLLAFHKQNEEEVLQKILLNPYISDETFMLLAPIVSEPLTQIIANNQVRTLATPEIIEQLKKNPNLDRTTLDRVLSFFRLNGVVLEGDSSELTDEEIRLLVGMPDDGDPIPEELLSDADDIPHVLTQEDEKILEQKKLSVFQLIQSMAVSKKIKLALKGNKEARSILIKDSNKLVASAVIKSPRITDMEVVNICNMKSIHDEVIRIISNKADWVKHYAVQVALANNPKTPFQVALKFARQMRVADLQKLSKSKNAPPQLVKLAKEIYEQKRK